MNACSQDIRHSSSWFSAWLLLQQETILVLNSAFPSNNLVQFGAFRLAHRSYFEQTGVYCVTASVCLFLSSLWVYLLKRTSGSCLVLGHPQHIQQLQPGLWPFISGEFFYLHTKITEVGADPSSLSASNGAEMLQKELLSCAVKADVFIRCPCFTFFQPVRQLPRGTPWRTHLLPGPTQRVQTRASHPVRRSRCLPTGSVQELKPADAFPRLWDYMQASSWPQILPFIDNRLTSADSIELKQSSQNGIYID